MWSSASKQPSSARNPAVPTWMLLTTVLVVMSTTRTLFTSPTKRKFVPVIQLMPSGPESPLFAPTQFAVGLHPAKALAPVPVM